MFSTAKNLNKIHITLCLTVFLPGFAVATDCSVEHFRKVFEGTNITSDSLTSEYQKLSLEILRSEIEALKTKILDLKKEIDVGDDFNDYYAYFASRGRAPEERNKTKPLLQLWLKKYIAEEQLRYKEQTFTPSQAPDNADQYEEEHHQL